MKTKHVYIVGSDLLGKALKCPSNRTGHLGLINAIRLRNTMTKRVPWDTFRIIEITNAPDAKSYDFKEEKTDDKEVK